MRKIVIITIIVVLMYTLFNYYNHQKSTDNITKRFNNIKNSKIYKDNLELSYIIDIINNGSNRLNYSIEMEGGFISKNMAKDVACYILEKRGNRCKDGYKKEASLYYSSNCAGCHGLDLKGIKNSFPSLLNKPFLGFKKWLNSL